MERPSLENLETPAALVDLKRVEANLRRVDERLMRLPSRVGLSVALDSRGALAGLSAAARKAGRTVGVLVELDLSGTGPCATARCRRPGRSRAAGGDLHE